LKTFTDQLEAALMLQLQAINHEHASPMSRAEASIQRILDAMEQLKKFILKYRFKSKAEEIEFFKHIKPKFLSKLIFQHKIFRIENKMPFDNDKAIKKYLVRELARLKKYINRNFEFHAYWRAESSHMDDKYFVRHQYDVRLEADVTYFDADPRFSTTHDYKAARLMAHDQLKDYLESRLRRLENAGSEQKQPGHAGQLLEWTESKASLVELIYALYYQGAVESSKAGIKEIAACFESVFRIELGDYYRTFTDIKMRKTGKAKFLESLRENLIKNMDDADSRV
jgi:hypothetical protein